MSARQRTDAEDQDNCRVLRTARPLPCGRDGPEEAESGEVSGSAGMRGQGRDDVAGGVAAPVDATALSA